MTGQPRLGRTADPAGRARAASAPARTIPPEQFLASPFATFFRTGDYRQALHAIEGLERAYPSDPLIIRYHAMVLDRLSRYEEAIALYKTVLAEDPDHTPTHVFLGQTYAHKGDKDAAASEWRWVIERGTPEEYRRVAQEQLAALSATAVRPSITQERFYLLADIGGEYDSNPRLKPSDKALAVQGDEQQAERADLNLSLGYRALTRPDARVDLLYTARQSLHDRSLDDVNFASQEFALNGRKRISVMDREVILGSRYDFLVGFLDGDLFSVSNRLLLGADMRLTPRTRTYGYNRFTVSNFGPDGSNPPQTSRDGFYDDLGVTQYLYTADLQRYLYVDQQLNVAQTRGANFTRRGTTTRVGIHTPIPYLVRTDLDASAGFRFGTYPRFTSLSSLDPERRTDTTWDLTTALTHYWTPRLATRLFYTWINANNRNDFFQYDRHIAGVHLLFTQSF